ncbi:MAG: type II secretion system protein GspE [Deltaproteobacteria bacterium]|nr:MAG: type II secretion system protein GspE [Deltaproteobacteria bacterium]
MGSSGPLPAVAHSTPDIAMAPLDLREDVATDESLPELDASHIELIEAVKPPDDPPRRKLRKRLGQQLLEAGLIDAAQLKEALDYQQVHGGRLGSILVTLGFLSEDDLNTELAKQLGLQVCGVESINPPAELLSRVPAALIRKHEVVPLSLQDRHLVVGMVDPGNVQAIDELRFVLDCRTVDVQLITETTFRRFLNTRFATAMLMDSISGDAHLEDTPVGLGPELHTAGGEERRDPVLDDADDPPVVRLVNYLLLAAVERRASDIHIEPYETFFRARFRIDGRLYTVLTPPLRMHQATISRIKILAGMDISDRRRPQDGHIMMEVGGDPLHFRVSTLPTTYGEKCVIRLLKKEAHLADLGQLGFSPAQLSEVRRIIRQPQGLVLVTGPTGSGKTTTLHAMLNDINEPETNIVTVEDPVESTIPGINHVQIEERGGVSFASALRSILRQDPDVVFIGEMRDEEVARIAIKAALTGHLVMSTLHTNGVIETFGRLADMNLEPYLLASSLRMVLAQRLLRRVCPACAEKRPVTRDLIEEFGLTEEQVAHAHLRVGTGCSRCMNTGYRGRVAVYESIVPNTDIGDILRRGGDEIALREAAERAGVVWMFQAGIARALAGESTFDEVRRVLSRSV